jgi:hypothetical protein
MNECVKFSCRSGPCCRRCQPGDVGTAQRDNPCSIGNSLLYKHCIQLTWLHIAVLWAEVLPLGVVGR